jgi:hypothetical protein
MEDRNISSGRNPIPIYNREIKFLAEKAVAPLKEFVETVELLNELLYQKHSEGRPNADADGLIKIAAMFYGRYIEKPTGYEYGGFFASVQYLRECLNLPSRDPSRIIKKVLKNYQQT